MTNLFTTDTLINVAVKMILMYLVVGYVLVFSAAESSEICKQCTCSNMKIDCTRRELEHHFNDSLWNSTSADVVLFDYNLIVHLKPFPSLPVTHLSLSNNYITKIDESAFKMLKNLTYLDLSGNELISPNLIPHIFKGTYSSEGYEPLMSLKVLKLSGNALHTLHPDVFEHLPNLQSLYLDSNPFKVLDHRTIIALSSVIKLEVLDLSSTMLSELPRTMFHSARYLKVLNISDNNFSKVPETVGELVSLEVLVIDNNPIQILSDFPAIENLQILKMRSMPLLYKIEEKALSSLAGLEELHCSYNPNLTEISGQALSRIPEGEEGQVWPPIKKVYLNDNKLRYLDSGLVGRWDHLENIDIQNNPWSCDCENQWLISTLIPLLQTNHINNTASLICQYPVEMQQKSLVELSQKKSHMRCLDIYGNRPERDASILIGTLLGVLLAIPLTLLLIMLYKRSLHKSENYFRAFYSPVGDSTLSVYNITSRS